MGAGCRWGDQQGPASQFGRNRSGVVRQCKQKSSSEIVNRSGVGTRQDQAAAWMQFQKWSMPMSRLCKSGAGPVSCPAAGQDCDCPSCIVSLVVNNQLIFFRSENILYNQKNIWSTTCSSRTGSTRTPHPGGGARSRGECHWNVLLKPINLFPYSVHWYTLCRLHYYKLSLLREGGAERMEIATEAVNTLKLSLLNYLESRYLSTLYPTIKTNVLTARICNIIPLLSDPSPSLPACIPAPDQHIYLFPAGHSGPERDDNSHHQSVQTLKLLTLQLEMSAVVVLDINKRFI